VKTKVEFSKDQLEIIEKALLHAGLKMLPVRDGFATDKTAVWWRSESGPQYINEAGNHWRNIKEYPEHYSLGEPRCSIVVTYLD